MTKETNSAAVDGLRLSDVFAAVRAFEDAAKCADRAFVVWGVVGPAPAVWIRRALFALQDGRAVPEFMAQVEENLLELRREAGRSSAQAQTLGEDDLAEFAGAICASAELVLVGVRAMTHPLWVAVDSLRLVSRLVREELGPFNRALAAEAAGELEATDFRRREFLLGDGLRVARARIARYGDAV